MLVTNLRFMLWALTFIFCGLGLVMTASTATLATDGEAFTYSFVIKQAAAMGVGLLCASFFSYVGPDFLRRNAVVGLLGLGILVTLAVTPFIGVNRYGATRWINLGPVMVQPAEIAKLVLIVVMAWYLVRVEERVRVSWNGVLMPMIGFAILALLVYRTKDLGSVVIMAGVVWVMLFYAGANWLYGTVLGLGAMPIVVYYAVYKTAYRNERILAFMDPWDPSNSAGYHLRQSFTAIGNGGEAGLGIGQGVMSKYQFLPEDSTDFVYAVIGEELGFIGTTGVAVGFLLLVCVGMWIAHLTKSRHHRLLVIGCSVLIGMQAFANMMVVIGLVPTKGLTLPFISYGGSSVAICCMLIGIIDGVARALPVQAKQDTDQLARLGATMVKKPLRVRTEEA